MATLKNSDDDTQGRLTGTQSIERALLLLREIAARPAGSWADRVASLYKQ